MKPVIVIGGGPGGTTAATILARHGHSVLLLEKDSFPRFHIGESLVPASQHVWDRLGLTEAFAQSNYIDKRAGELRMGVAPDQTDHITSCIHFTKVPKSLRPWRPEAYQVERASFDAQLLDNAIKSGVQVVQQARVKSVDVDQRTLTWSEAGAEERVTEAAFIIDASGRRALLSRALGLFKPEERHPTSSVFGHFKDVHRPEGEEGGYTETYFIKNGWVWMIPLGDGVTSVGLVLENKLAKDWSGSPDKILQDVLQSDAYLRERFKGATPTAPARIMRNLPYRSKKSTGPGWCLVGDASFFVDPLNSTGIHVAVHSGMMAADAVHAALDGDSAQLEAYEREMALHYRYVRRSISIFYEIVEYRALLWFFIRATGDWGGHWSGPWLRRIAAWAMGMYTSYIPALYPIWIMFGVLTRVCGFYYAVTGRPKWGSYESATMPAINDENPQCTERG